MSSNNYCQSDVDTLFTPRSASQTMTIELIKSELYWISSKDIPNKSADSILIFSDQSHRYQPFNYDFGPLHLGEVYKFINKVDSALRICKKSNTKVCIFTGFQPQKQANSVFLVCSFLILARQIPVQKAFSYFKDISSALPPFRDATADPFSTHKCYLIDCLEGLKFAHEQRWFNLNTFDLQEYDYISQKGNGDYNDIIPGKMIAFSGPLSERPRGSIGQVYTPEDYVPLFKKLGVTLVVRLNEKHYDERIFIKNGINHLNLIFEDGSTPSDEIVQKFLEASEQTKGVVAVHCKSGFGRTGTLIGMYAMKHFKIPSKAFIGWVRIARPGSIHGPQHEFLVDKEEEMFVQGGFINQQFSSPVKNNKQYGKSNATPIKSDHNQKFSSTMTSFRQNNNNNNNIDYQSRQNKIPFTNSQIRNSVENQNLKKYTQQQQQFQNQQQNFQENVNTFSASPYQKYNKQRGPNRNSYAFDDRYGNSENTMNTSYQNGSDVSAFNVKALFQKQQAQKSPLVEGFQNINIDQQQQQKDSTLKPYKYGNYDQFSKTATDSFKFNNNNNSKQQQPYVSKYNNRFGNSTTASSVSSSNSSELESYLQQQQKYNNVEDNYEQKGGQYNNSPNRFKKQLNFDKFAGTEYSRRQQSYDFEKLHRNPYYK